MLLKYFSAILLICTAISLCQESKEGSISDNHLKIVLIKSTDNINGIFEDFNDFTLTIDIDKNLQDDVDCYDDLIKIVNNNEVSGLLNYPIDLNSKYAGTSTDIRYVVVNHRGYDEIYMKTTLGYFLWEFVSIKDDTISFYIDWWYKPPATEADIKIIDMAETILKDSTIWDRDDNRKCDFDNKTKKWSLFCALKYASITISGEYNHHNNAIQTVRFVIDDIVSNHNYNHTLMDFNNDDVITHKNILEVLSIARGRIEKELINK